VHNCTLKNPASDYHFENAIAIRFSNPDSCTRDGNFGNRKAFKVVLRHFSLRMRRIGIIYASGPKSVITVVFSDIDFL